MDDFGRREKLIGLGSEVLADALLDLSLSSEVADELIERLIAAPKENQERFIKKLSRLKKSNRFIWRKGKSLSNAMILTV